MTYVSLTRRKFLALTGSALTAATLSSRVTRAAQKKTKRPNILLIITDQQSATMMSCAGNKWLKTPAMDSLMEKGMRFEKAYAANPVCVPSRFSILTGHYPSAVGIRKNGSSEEAVRFLPNALGNVIGKAGYETVYGGKVHLPGAMNKIDQCGFRVLTKDQRGELAEECVRFLKSEHDRPFLLVASFINPHDICYYAIQSQAGTQSNGKKARVIEAMEEAKRLPEGVSRDQFFRDYCPPLPTNHETTEDEPKAFQVAIDDRAFKRYIRENWGDEEWRTHRWIYARLTERVDAQIGLVLGALRDAGLEDDTVVVFTSDHGDMDASHKLEHKSMAYEESARIPMIVQYPGMSKPGHIDREHLVSNGLDILPTLCDIAGAAPPNALPGRSIKPLLSGDDAPADWRKALMIETQFSRAVTDGRFKYTLFDAAGSEELLCDLRNDPGEMKNLAGKAEHQKILNRMRAALKREVRKHGVKMQIPG